MGPGKDQIFLRQKQVSEYCIKKRWLPIPETEYQRTLKIVQRKLRSLKGKEHLHRKRKIQGPCRRVMNPNLVSVGCPHRRLAQQEHFTPDARMPTMLFFVNGSQVVVIGGQDRHCCCIADLYFGKTVIKTSGVVEGIKPVSSFPLFCHFPGPSNGLRSAS